MLEEGEEIVMEVMLLTYNTFPGEVCNMTREMLNNIYKEELLGFLLDDLTM